VNRSVRWTEAAIVEALREWVARYGEVPTRVDWDRHMCRRRGHDAKLARLDAHPESLPSPTPVLARFGSWEAALAAAGFKARFTPHTVSAQELRQTAALYESDLSVAQVGARLGRDPKTVRERLDRAGVARRPPRRRELPDEQQAAIVAAAIAGASVRELSRRFGFTDYAVRVVLDRHDAAGPSYPCRAGELRSCVERAAARGRRTGRRATAHARRSRSAHGRRTEHPRRVSQGRREQPRTPGKRLVGR
jgi:DNA-directed RNA polymerase specialized sigma24 family protein